MGILNEKHAVPVVRCSRTTSPPMNTLTQLVFLVDSSVDVQCSVVLDSARSLTIFGRSSCCSVASRGTQWWLPAKLGRDQVKRLPRLRSPTTNIINRNEFQTYHQRSSRIRGLTHTNKVFEIGDETHYIGLTRTLNEKRIPASLKRTRETQYDTINVIVQLLTDGREDAAR